VTEISVEIQEQKILFYRISGKKKLRTAIEWDYGILPSSSTKGLPIDTNV
jgi:hypothetical protein